MARKLLKKLFLFFCAATLATGAMTANAAPLAPGTALKITAGVGSGFNTPCITGSCYSQEIVPGALIWTDILPGTDGGFIVGKSQASGGQEINASSTADGELTAASPMGMALIIGIGTLYTLPDGGSVNVFDDASCTKLACISKTALQTLNMAVNGSSVPMGSALGCTGPGGINCSPDQKAGIFVNSYNIDLVGKTWSMDYAQAVPSGPVPGVRFTVIFRGTVVPSNCPIVDYAWSVPGARSLMVFGSNLQGATSVMIDGVNAPVFQPIGDDLLWVFPPDSVTWPWKPGTVQVTNANAGCSGSYPKPCAPAILLPPTITSFASSEGPPGTGMNIQGSNFCKDNCNAETAVFINNVAADIVFVSPTLILLYVAAATPLGSGPITVLAPGGMVKTSTNFTVTAP